MGNWWGEKGVIESEAGVGVTGRWSEEEKSPKEGEDGRYSNGAFYIKWMDDCIVYCKF